MDVTTSTIKISISHWFNSSFYVPVSDTVTLVILIHAINKRGEMVILSAAKYLTIMFP